MIGRCQPNEIGNNEGLRRKGGSLAENLLLGRGVSSIHGRKEMRDEHKTIAVIRSPMPHKSVYHVSLEVGYEASLHYL